MPAVVRWGAAAVAAAAAAYGGYVGMAWMRYGSPLAPRPDEADPLLDEFLPAPEVAERHSVRVVAPAAVTLAAACELDLFGMPAVQALFKTRATILGARNEPQPLARGLIASARSIGWVVLAEIPGREVVVGAVTRPWEADATFRSIEPGRFAEFSEPDYVKIAWTLRADPIDAAHSVFRTETRVVATDATARRKFRRYWSLLSPGIIMIRWVTLNPVRREAERRAAIHGRSSDSLESV